MKSTSSYSIGNPSVKNDIHTKITMLVDDELPQAEKQQLLAEINKNPEWQRIYEQERKFKAYIQKHAAQRKAPANLIKNLKAQIELPADGFIK